MFDKFSEIKQQLTELADIINRFKSEAVQMRIVELMFNKNEASKNQQNPAGNINNPGGEAQPIIERNSPKKRRKSKKTNAVRLENSDTKEDRKARKSNGRPGPGQLIDTLINEGFFNAPKTITHVIEHAKKNLAFDYKPAELSTSFTRAIRAKKLTRDKNEEQQFEYTAK